MARLPGGRLIEKRNNDMQPFRILGEMRESRERDD